MRFTCNALFGQINVHPPKQDYTHKKIHDAEAPVHEEAGRVLNKALYNTL